MICLFSLVVSGMQAQVKQQQTSIKPVGDRLVLKTVFVLDELRQQSNQQTVYTPILEGKDGQTVLFKSLMVNGRRQHLYYKRNGNKNYPDALEVERRNYTAQQVDYLSAVPYEEWMDGATLRINTDTCGCGNLLGNAPGEPLQLDFHPERGICLAFLPPVAAPDPVVSLSGKAYLDYPVNRTELHPDYRNNPRELQKIVATIDTVRNNPKVEIMGIDIHGYASPEGSWSNNERLSKGRAASLKDYVKQLCRLDDRIFTVSNTPEDWAGLDSLISGSALSHKDEILQIVRDHSLEPDPRNERIKTAYPEEYQFILNTWYPALRHSDYAVQYRIRPMTDREAAELLHTQPQLLSLNKMFRIANLYEPGSDAYNEVFDIAVRLYPSDPVANLNAANIALKKHDLEAAARYLEKADPSLPQTVHARGVLALLQGRYAEARTLLEQAQQAGIAEAATNLEILQKLEQ